MTTETIIDEEIGNPKVSPVKIAVKWATIGILVSIIQSLTTLYLNDFKYDPQGGGIWLMAFGIAMIFTVLFMSIKEYRDKELGGYIRFGNAFKTGFVTSIFLVLFTLIYTFIFYNLIIDYDTMMADQLGRQMQMLKERGLSDAEIKKALEMSKGFLSSQTFSFIAIMLGGLILDTILSLIAAALLKKDLPVS